MAARHRLVVAAGVAALLGAACDGGSGEPDGLSGTTASTESPAASEPTEEATAEPTGESEPSPTSTAAEPEPTFTQPYVPGDPSVIALPESFPVETDGDVGAQEQEVVDALGHAMAAWDGMLFGAGPAEADINTWFAGPMWKSLTDYASESHSLERVSVGSPTRIVLRDVTVNEEEATVDVCLYTEDWVEYVGGEEGEPVDPVSTYQMPAEHNGENWQFTHATTAELDC